MFSIVSTKVKLKLIEITFCRLIVALGRVTVGPPVARELLSGIDGIRRRGGEMQRGGVGGGCSGRICQLREKL